VALTKARRTLVEKARALGASQQGAALSEEACVYLVAVIVSDLALLEYFPEFRPPVPDFFGNNRGAQALAGLAFEPLFERLIDRAADADTYFSCLAALHKRRLKYERILQMQPVPTMDQVGPRGLLQYGVVSPRALLAFLLWRKWIYDIDARAAQETGYVFEAIIAAALGGAPATDKKSPIRRQSDPTKRRQVDCVRDKDAYEIKIRVTIAASGQGRWREELLFATDCRASGYNPVLVVLDPTPNPKLEELRKAFIDKGGRVYVGKDAWEHLEGVAGETMGRFLQLYVHSPLEALLAEVPEQLPELRLTMTGTAFTASIAEESFTVYRSPAPPSPEKEKLPDDVDEEIPGQ